MRPATLRTPGNLVHSASKRLELFLNSCTKLPTAGCEYSHVFGGGVYIREMHLKPTTLIVGAAHKKETMAMLTQGTLRIFTEDGVRTFTAPATITTPPGTQRVGYAVDKVIFCTIHPYNGESIEEIEDAWTGDSSALLGRPNNLQSISSKQHEKPKQLGEGLPERGRIQHLRTGGADV